jgi:hypothetical protein
MVKTKLTAADACLIIETSAKAGVTELSFGDLQISFVPKFGQGEEVVSPRMQQEPLTEKQHIKMTKEQIEAEELRMRQEQMEEMLLSDPLQFEEMLQRGELDVPRTNDGDEIE